MGNSYYQIHQKYVLTHLSLEKKWRHLADDNLGCIFLNENICILIKISPKLVPKRPIDNDQALV